MASSKLLYKKKYKSKYKKGKKTVLQKLAPKMGKTTESKYHAYNVTQTDVSIDNTNVVKQLVNGISQGTSVSGRIGRMIHMKSLQWRTMVQPHPNITSGNDQFPAIRNYWIRQLLVYDKKPDGALPQCFGSTGNQILESIGGGQADILAHKSVDNSNRYIIIMDKTYECKNFDNVQLEDKKIWLFEKYKKLDVPVEFAQYSNGGAIADFKMGALYLYTMCSIDPSGKTTLYQPTVTVNARLKYTDA